MIQHTKDVGNKYVDELEEELTLSRGKNSGHRRIDPQAPAENVSFSNRMFKCEQCNVELESQGLLDAHKIIHMKENISFLCNLCSLNFEKTLDLEMHNIEQHEGQQHSEELICNDCSFQASEVAELMKHMQLTSCSPSTMTFHHETPCGEINLSRCLVVKAPCERKTGI